jgi:hypothetical protein
MSDQPEHVVSWCATPAYAPVIAIDGPSVGNVAEVAGLPNEDMFHGVNHGDARSTGSGALISALRPPFMRVMLGFSPAPLR